MEQTMTLVTVGAGMVFSITIALLVEELVFGGLFRLFFGRKPQPVTMTPLRQSAQWGPPGTEGAETLRSRR